MAVTLPGTGRVVASETVDGEHVQVVSTKTALTPAAPANATVGVASAEAVAARTTRKGLVLVNTSANWIFLGFGANAAVVNKGISLSPNGGSWTMDEHTFTRQAVNAIAEAGGSNLGVQEYD